MAMHAHRHLLRRESHSQSMERATNLVLVILSFGLQYPPVSLFTVTTKSINSISRMKSFESGYQLAGP